MLLNVACETVLIAPFLPALPWWRPRVTLMLVLELYWWSCVAILIRS
jgi:hypothetical protein